MAIKLVRDDIDHTECARLGLPRVYFGGVASPSRHHVETAAGKVYATTTCMVVIETQNGPVVLTEEEARNLSRALSVCALTAKQHDKYRRGELTRKITVENGASSITYTGETWQLRMHKAPLDSQRYANCDECRERLVSSYWASYRVTDKGWGTKTRIGEIRICADCYPKLVVQQNAKPELVRST
jgi:hypothetical protein